jgi:hypothetical protein
MSRLNAPAWYGTGGQNNIRIQNDPAEITCALLQRLKAKLDQERVRPLLVTNASAQDVTAGDRQSRHLYLVEECAQDLGYQSLSVFKTFRETFKSDPSAFDTLFVITKGVRGHMSKAGNAIVAGLVAEALKAPQPAAKASLPTQVGVQSGDGQNLVVSSETLERVFHESRVVRLQRLQEPAAPRLFRATAVGALSQHYLQSQNVAFDGGPITVSIELKPERADKVRLQLVDAGGTGMVANFDLARHSSSTDRTGPGEVRQMRASIEPVGDSWLRLAFGANVPAGELRFPLHFVDGENGMNFVPSGESVLLRAQQLERGQTASSYQPTSGPLSKGFVPGDGENLVPKWEEILKTTPAQSAAIKTVDAAGKPPAYRVVAVGEAGEHFVGFGNVKTRGGPHTLSMVVRKTSVAGLRVQLFDERVSGAIGDFDTKKLLVSQIKLGKPAVIDAAIEAVGGDHVRITLTSRWRPATAAFCCRFWTAGASPPMHPRMRASK